MPSWIGPWEIAIVVIILLVVFGPKRLPGLGRSLGKAIPGFKKGLKETEEEFRKAVSEESEPEQAAKTTGSGAESAAQPKEATEASDEEKSG
jgi:sec-independent protein translocase protein TatA